MGYMGAYAAVKRYVAAIRPGHGPRPYELRFETKAGVQGQAGFARFAAAFTGEPGVVRIVWLFSLVLGYSRFLFARYVLHQDLQTLLRRHCLAFEALGGVPVEILCGRMKTAVTGGDGQGRIVCSRPLLALARHCRFQPRACRPYRARTKGKAERAFRYIREDFFLGRSFRGMEDLNAQLIGWLGTAADVRVHGTARRAAAEAFAGEQAELQRLPGHRFNAVLKPERRVSHDGLAAAGGNYRTRRIAGAGQLPDLVRIIDRGAAAEHPVPEGCRQYRIGRRHRTGRVQPRTPDRPVAMTGRIGDRVPLRSLAICGAAGAHLAMEGRP